VGADYCPKKPPTQRKKPVRVRGENNAGGYKKPKKRKKGGFFLGVNTPAQDGQRQSMQTREQEHLNLLDKGPTTLGSEKPKKGQKGFFWQTNQKFPQL